VSTLFAIFNPRTRFEMFRFSLSHFFLFSTIDSSIHQIHDIKAERQRVCVEVCVKENEKERERERERKR